MCIVWFHCLSFSTSHAINNWDTFFKATQLDLHWFTARAFYCKNVHISLLASLGKLSSGLQVVWSLISSSSMISFSPFSVHWHLFRLCFQAPPSHLLFHMGSAHIVLLPPAFPFLTFAQLLSNVSFLASVTVQPLISSCNSKNWQKRAIVWASLLLFAQLV